MNRISSRKYNAELFATLFFFAFYLAGVSGICNALVQKSKLPEAKESKASSQGSDPQAYVGTWQAKFQDKVFLTIKLESHESKLTGTMSRGNIGVNDEGELVSAEPMDGTDPITEARVGFGVLRLTKKSQGEDESIQFEMKLTSADAGEIRIVGIPEEEKIKPWKLERVKAAK